MYIPPLRDRTDDIPLLAYRFAMRTADEMGKKLEGIAPETLERLQRHAWPGNVRELQHVIERAVILTPDPVLPPHALESDRFSLTHSIVDGPPSAPAWAPSAPDLNGGGASDGAVRVVLTSLDVNEAEKILIQEALKRANDNRTRAAEMLGISVRTLRNKLNNPGAE
jgi:DNA-binding NtrC family response regulator